MDKIDGKTRDIVAENVGKLKELFPEVFTEGKVSFDALKEVLGTFVDDRDERYSFTWNGKSRARMIAQTPSTGTLRPCKEESVDWDTTQNIFIEGDNLEVLKLLQKSYFKKVKMIYIDPPYNTGKDFVYKDNFKDNIKNYKEITGQVDGNGRNLSNNPETSGRYHTDWLNMMYPRLKLARNLLRDDGVIFIHIDKSEFSNLEKILNEIFGEENFLGSFVWRKKEGGGMADAYFVTEHEYIIVFQKSDAFKWVDEILDVNISDYNQKDSRGNYKLVKIAKWGNTAKREDRPSMYFPINDPDGNDNYPVAPDGSEGRWRMGKQRISELLSNNLIEFKMRGDNWTPYEKIYFDPASGKINKSRSILYKIGGTGVGSNELTNLFGKKDVFDNPKPTQILKSLGKFNCNSSDIILDFFAGSGTTAHAVMQLNAEDGGNRKFIMVQLPEKTNGKSEAFKAGYKTIAEISKERIRRAAAKIKEELTTKHVKDLKKEGKDLFNEADKEDFCDFSAFRGSKLPDLGFKVFKLDSTNIKPWDADFDTLDEKYLKGMEENIKPDRSKEDLLYEILIKYGLELTLPIDEWILDDGQLVMKDEKQSQGTTVEAQLVYIIGMGALIVYLSDTIRLEVVEGIAKLKDELKPEIMRVVFKDSGFKDDVVKTNAVQILKQAGIVDVKSI